MHFIFKINLNTILLFQVVITILEDFYIIVIFVLISLLKIFLFMDNYSKFKYYIFNL